MSDVGWTHKQTGWTRQDLLVMLMEGALGSITADLRAIALLIYGDELEVAIYLKRLTPELEADAEFIFAYFMSTSAITDFQRSIYVGSEPMPTLMHPSAYTLLSKEAASI